MRRRLAFALVAALGALAAAWFGLPSVGPGYPPSTGPGADVHVTRGADGAPHVRAAGGPGDRYDLFYGQGYATAADRMFQLDWSRRGLYGRRAEVAGREWLVADFRSRALDLERVARDVYGGLAEEDQAACRAYADGVNAWLRGHARRLPREFRLLDYKPRPWRPEDCAAVWRGMALTLTDLTDDLDAPARSDLAPVPDEAPPAVSGLGSNGWAASGALTESGFPLLAGDPHLEMTVPGALHRVALADDTVAFTGFALPGVPGLAFGRCAAFAWTVTAFEGDNCDVFRYPVDPERRGYCRTLEGERQVRTFRPCVWLRLWRQVTVPIFWQPLERTEDGPVIERTATEIRVLRWAGAGALPGEALLTVQVLDVDSLATLESLLSRQGLPDVNVVYADRDGHIAHYVAGMIPLREPHVGPRDGMDAALRWRGFVPFADLPREVDPPEGYVYSANGPPRRTGGPYLGHDWPTAREARIAQLLEESAGLTPALFAEWQLDVLVPGALEDLTQRFDTLAANSLEEVARQALPRLVEWDGRATTDAVGATLYRAWNHFGPGAAGWNRACRWLERRLGPDPAEWQWGRVHQARLGHALARRDSSLTRSLIPRAGDRGTLNVAGWARFDTTGWPPMVTRHGPALRFVADLAPEGETQGVLLPGVSGDPDSPHAFDQLDDWSAGVLRRLPGPGEWPEGPVLVLRAHSRGQ